MGTFLGPYRFAVSRRNDSAKKEPVPDGPPSYLVEFAVLGPEIRQKRRRRQFLPGDPLH